MKRIKADKLKDGQKFKRSERSKVWYKLINKNKRTKQFTFTSLSSEKSFTKYYQIVFI